MHEEPNAVVFQMSDYATPGRRLASFLIDLAVMFVLGFAFINAVAFVVTPREVLTIESSRERSQKIVESVRKVQVPMFLGLFAFFGVYHIMLRTMRRGTIGYRLTGVRLVDHQGLSPSIRTVLRRFLIALPGCSLFAAAYLLCSQDPRRQALHDQWSGTWVVRYRAQPAGPARTTFHPKMIGPFVRTYMDVEPVGEHDRAEPAPPGEGTRASA